MNYNYLNFVFTYKTAHDCIAITTGVSIAKVVVLHYTKVPNLYRLLIYTDAVKKSPFTLFQPCATKLITGSHSGEVKIFNLSDSNEEYSYACHESYLNSIKCSRDGRLLLTSCAWRSPMSVLWNVDNNRFTHKLQWDEEEYLEFPNIMQDKVLATTGEVASLQNLFAFEF